MKCFILDDEPVGRKIIAEFVADIPFLEYTGQAGDPLKAAALLAGQPADLLFLDIQMPRMSGLDFLKSMPHPPLAILTTAYPEFALQGYELDVVDYLLKPIAFERFFKACLKARELHDLKTGAMPAASEDYFFVKCDSKYEKIRFADLLCVEAADNYVLLHTRERRLITYLTFKSIEAHLPPEQFLKVHKSFVVATAQVQSVDGSDLLLPGGKRVPVSRNLRTEVLERVLGGKVLKR